MQNQVWQLTGCLCFLIFFNSCEKDPDISNDDFIVIDNYPEIIAEYQFSTTSNDEFFFGDINDVKVVETGNIVVLDDETLSIHLLSNNGVHIYRKSIQGRGPGEMENLSKRLRIADNMVAVDDFYMLKIALFQIINSRIEHMHDIALESAIGNFFLTDEKHLILKKSMLLNDEKIADKIERLDMEADNITNSILEFPAQKEIRLTASLGGVDLGINTTTKFHALNRYCFNGNRLYYILTDSLGFSVYDLESGNEIFSSIYHQPKKRLTFEEKEKEVDRILESGKEFWGHSEKQRLISEMPDSKPAVRSVKCELPNGIWMKLMDGNTEEEERWVLLSADGKIQGMFINNLEGEIISFDKGKIFISNISKDGDIVLNTYEYKIKS